MEQGHSAAELPTGVSIVVPVYNGELTLADLVAQLAAVLPDCSERFEAILVDDDSSDQSWGVICALATRYPFVRGIALSRNFGQHNATLCGVHAARYSITVTMDDDLQHLPSHIPALLGRLADGYDLVYGTPEAKPRSWYRNLGSRLLKRGLAVAMRQPMIVNIESFRAFRTTIRSASENYAGPRMLLDVLLGWGTTRIAAVRIPDNERPQGSSSYSFGKLLEMAALAWTSYTTVPLRLATLLGFFFVGFGAAVLTYLTIRYLAVGSTPGFTFLASLITILGGVQLAFLGVVGEYLGNVFDRSLNRPVYVVRSTTPATGESGDRPS